MHISDGILAPPVLAAGALLSAGGLGIGLRRIRDEDIPRTAMLTAAFFVASLIHVPLGPSTVHLIINGLAGIILGWAAFPALFIGLLLQALLFGYGGLSVLGVNTFNTAAPAVLCGSLFHLLRRRSPDGLIKLPVAAGLCTALCIAMTGLLNAVVLITSHSRFMNAALALLAAHVPVMIIEAVLSASIIAFLLKTRPDLLEPRA